MGGYRGEPVSAGRWGCSISRAGWNENMIPPWNYVGCQGTGQYFRVASTDSDHNFTIRVKYVAVSAPGLQ